MAIYKCKMCGGDLDVKEGQVICECEFCGTKQTLPKNTDEGLSNLFNRANALRMKSEFDKAEELYNKIIDKDNTEAEAYWGIVLCKYGIEYVEDPTTYKRIPTCHRTSFESIVTDSDYLEAIKYADISQKELYEAEAKKIDQIQKNILKIVNKEKPFDVFICYKETDKDGNRTQDSVIANDIYYQLTNEGFKVFYSAITLEDKLGQEYEPYIFAALNSAKVMLVVGTNADYYTSVWVKNEWSRFLKLMKNDRNKLLIPCYKDIDAYELPDEFAHLQAQNMAKIGFITDLVRGIKKVIKPEHSQQSQRVETSVSQFANIPVNLSSLLKRANMFLEDGEWDEANTYFEKVLDNDPENADAYLGKVLAKYKCHNIEELALTDLSFFDDSLYKKIVRFGSLELIERLKEIKIKHEEAIQEQKYQNLINQFNNAASIADYILVENAFKLIDYKDSEEYSKLAKNRILEIKARDEEIIKEQRYSNAISLFSSFIVSDIKAGKKVFLDLGDYKESKLYVDKCVEKIEQKKKTRKIKFIILGCLAFLAIIIILTFTCFIPNYKNNHIKIYIYSCDETKGIVTGSGVYKHNSKIQLTATPIDDYVFAGWYSDSKCKVLVSRNELYTFVVPASSINLYAKFYTKEEQQEEWNISHGVIPSITTDGTITYGLYPQTVVSDTTLINELNKLTSQNRVGWYYYDNEYYYPVYAKPYSSYTFQNGSTVVKDTKYWFKCEPIEWIILENNDGTYKLLTKYLLDAHRFDDDSNNYKNSGIRSWLNNDFYNMAFYLNNSYIQTTIVDNSAASTLYSSNKYICEDTNDLVYLLSANEVTTTSYGFASSASTDDTARQAKVTDFAVARGARYVIGNGRWWLRSPYYYDSSHARYVDLDGYVYHSYVSSSDSAVRAAITISLMA